MEHDNPYAPPMADLDNSPRLAEISDGWRDGDLLVVPKGAELPDHCLKCNAPAQGYRFKRTLYWLHPTWFILFLMSPLIYILVYLIIRKKGKATAGLCVLHRKRRRRAILLGWLTSLAGIPTAFAASFVPDPYQAVPIIAGLVLLFAGVIGGMIGSQVLIPKRIDKQFIWLNKVSPDLLAEYPPWPA